MSTAKSSPRVLVAHETLDTALAVAALLLCRGYAVDVATDEEQTRVKLGQGVDALVVDLAMPGALGEALPRLARSRGAKVVVALGEIHRSSSYRHKPTRLYGADRLVEMHLVNARLADVLAELLHVPSSIHQLDPSKARHVEALCQRILVFSGALDPAERAWISAEIAHRKEGGGQFAMNKSKGGAQR